MAVKAYGTKLQYKDGGDFEDLARVKSIKPAKLTAKEIDTTTLESPDEMEEFVAGLGNGGEVEATIEYDKDRTADLYELYRVSTQYRIRYPDGSGHEYDGWLSEI